MSKSTARKLYKAARIVNDIETLLSGDPTKIIRRGKNKILGRFLFKLLRGIWK